MISLAAWRFRNVAASRGGPIDRVELCELQIAGQRHFQANAFLRPELVRWKCGGELFSDAAGSGTDVSPMVARFKAVSEAIERWAQMSVIADGTGAAYGFDLDPSSSGMAAFPGWRGRQARQHALYEAAERFNLLQWWEGRLSARECASPYPDVTAALLVSDAPGITVLAFRRAEGIAAYGHAAAETIEEAHRSAIAELERHHASVRVTRLAHVAFGHLALSPQAHPIERRSLYFSTPEGHEHFLHRLRSPATRPLLRPRVVFDGAVPGPWTRYASVWRVCFAPPSDRFLGDDPTYFYW